LAIAPAYFKPLEPFVVDDRADHNHPGRIARRSLDPLWRWFSRDLLPAEAKALADDLSNALLAGDEPKAEHLVRAFQDKAAAGIDAILAAGVADEKNPPPHAGANRHRARGRGRRNAEMRAGRARRH
jgi:hypothetical protein